MFAPNSTPHETCSLERTKIAIEIVPHVLYGSLFALEGRATQKRISVIYIFIQIMSDNDNNYVTIDYFFFA